MRATALFYPKLAVSNMKKNGGIYLPYLLAGILLSGLYYIILAVGDMTLTSGMKGAAEMSFLLDSCAKLCIVIMFLILFYINSFVMKRRKRELGLYCILGMEKRHLGRLLFWEVSTAAAVSIVCGIVCGALFSQFLFLVLLKLVQIPAQLTFTMPLSAVGATTLVFAAGYLATLLYDWMILAKTNPISLLKSRQEGEREPKSKWFTALVGAVVLLWGYSIALRVQNASEGLLVFFPAALLVIIGTYCLFLAGSIVFLKFLRKRKRFYYRPENFISVSGMLYRMKQNAAGLATIAILSTALLVTLSTSVALYLGEEGKLKENFPRENRLWTQAAEGSSAWGKQVHDFVEQAAAESGVGLTAYDGFIYADWTAYKEGSEFTYLAAGKRPDAKKNRVSMTVLLQEDYEALTGEEVSLAADEILYIAPRAEKKDTVTIGGKLLRIQNQVPRPAKMPGEIIGQEAIPAYLAVVADEAVFQELLQAQDASLGADYYAFFELEGEAAAGEAFRKAVAKNWTESEFLLLDTCTENREEFYLLYGSILFVGILFTVLFLLATVLIIYYKQVTEGYDDRERFSIMEKVGMQESEIRATINKQVLLVFFLPLGTAILHIAVAGTVLQKIVAVLGLSNPVLFWICVAACCLLFSGVYLLVYHLTSRVYYRIVHGKKESVK